MNKKISYFVQVSIGALFISAGLAKLLFLGTMYSEIMSYKILPDAFIMPIAIILPITEMILGFLFMMSWKFKEAAGALTGLLIIFLLAKASTVVRGIDLSNCFCLGTLLSLPLWASTILNVVLFGGIAYAYKGHSVKVNEQRNEAKAGI